MDPQRWRLIDDLFGRVIELPPSEQQSFIKAYEGSDPELALQLLSMLNSDRSSSFLDGGAQSVASSLLDDAFEDIIGPYRRRRCLGEGGMGVVYLAEHAEWGTFVAIKVPRDAWISPDRKERFAAEQRVLAQLTHPAIARIYEGGTGPNGTPWFAMEYVEGQPITEFARARNLTIEERLRLFRQACEAVQYAHSQAIIHRDLKPSNIFVTPTGQVKLLDFGIAKQMEDIGRSGTRSGAQPLTMAYAAPEQVSANRVSAQSDVYSLGVTLYELLTGNLPLDVTGLTPSQAEQVISTKVPEKPSALSQLPLKRTEWAELDVLVLKTLHKDVAQRYSSVDALIRDVDHFLKREPLEARPESVIYRLRKFIERRRLPIAASVSFLVLIASVLIYYTWQLAKARDEAVAQAKREKQIQLFMTDLFAGGDQVNGPSKDLRVVDMLAAGVDKAKQFDDQPLVQADLYNTLGTVYQSIGELEKAAKLLRLALTRFTRTLGPESKEVAETMVYIALLEDSRGQYSRADLMARKAVAIVGKIKPADPVLLARDETALAHVLIDENRYLETLTLLESAGEIQSKRPETHDDWLANLNLQATADIQLHRYSEAERLTHYLISMDQQRHPRLRPEDANDIINLGQIEQMQSHFDNAEQSYRQALRIYKSWFAEGHPDVANTKRLLAQVLEKQGKYEEATSLSRNVLAEAEHAYGPWHLRVAYALRLLSKLAYARHDVGEARTDISREISIYRKIGDDEDLPAALSDLADLDVAEEDVRPAEVLYEDALRRFPTTKWADGIAMAHAEMMLGEIRAKQNRFSEAEPLLLQSLALWRKLPVLRTRETGDTLTYLARTYDGLGQPEKGRQYRAQLAALRR